MPAALVAFVDGEGFEDCVKNAVSLDGDTDTLGCITGSIAEAFYGIPKDLINECRNRSTPDMRDVVDRFYKWIHTRKK